MKITTNPESIDGRVWISVEQYDFMVSIIIGMRILCDSEIAGYPKEHQKALYENTANLVMQAEFDSLEV